MFQTILIKYTTIWILTFFLLPQDFRTVKKGILSAVCPWDGIICTLCCLRNFSLWLTRWYWLTDCPMNEQLEILESICFCDWKYNHTLNIPLNSNTPPPSEAPPLEGPHLLSHSSELWERPQYWNILSCISDWMCLLYHTRISYQDTPKIKIWCVNSISKSKSNQ